MQILIWILFGALVGWISSLIMNTNNQQGIFLNIFVGIVGAILGGYIMNIFGETGITGFNAYSFVVATIGAVVLLAIVKLVRRA